jgi:hypothetical protein
MSLNSAEKVQVRFFFSFTKRKEEQNKFTTMFNSSTKAKYKI